MKMSVDTTWMKMSVDATWMGDRYVLGFGALRPPRDCPFG